MSVWKVGNASLSAICLPICRMAKHRIFGHSTEEFGINWKTVVFNMLTVKGIYGREMYETWYQ